MLRLQEISSKLSQIQEQVEQDKTMVKELDNDSLLLKKELQDQDLKLHRAESQLRKLIRELRSKSDSTMFAMEEVSNNYTVEFLFFNLFSKHCLSLVSQKDISLRELIEQNQTALEMLTEIGVKHMEAAPVISQHLKARDRNHINHSMLSDSYILLSISLRLLI